MTVFFVVGEVDVYIEHSEFDEVRLVWVEMLKSENKARVSESDDFCGVGEGRDESWRAIF